MHSLPRNARFVGGDNRQYIVFTPASDADGYVITDRMTFTPQQARRDVEVTYPGNQS